jgi:hypothetical protein
VTDLRGDKLCTIQVKARRELGADGGWHMKKKHEQIFGDRLFYCFVNFGNSPDENPSIFLMPGKVVAEALMKSYAAWLSTPGKRGQKHNDHNMRRLLPDHKKNFGDAHNPYPRGWMERYRNAWDLLGLQANTDLKNDDIDN